MSSTTTSSTTMSSTEVHGRLEGDPTQYANYAGSSDEMYCEAPAAYPDMYYVNTLPADSEFAPGPQADAQKWPLTLLLAGVGLVAAFLLAFLTLSMVRAGDPVEATPSGVVTHTMTAASTERAAPQRNNQPAVVQPTAQPRSSATMTSPVRPQPPATMTNPLEPPPATMTNPLEPPPATMTNPLPQPSATKTVTVTPQPPLTMTNPLEPPPATMTNPLEPPPATMTNPLEPPLIGSSASDE